MGYTHLRINDKLGAHVPAPVDKLALLWVADTSTLLGVYYNCGPSLEWREAPDD
jgi:hypothetical protein